MIILDLLIGMVELPVKYNSYGPRLTPENLHQMKNSKWAPGGYKMADGFGKGSTQTNGNRSVGP